MSNTCTVGCEDVHMPAPEYGCPTCGLRYEILDEAHLPIVEAIHALARCWDDDQPHPTTITEKGS